ncbi:hypothetical protein AQPE_4457 [Aquipluma nitroreducens]|uniref:Uncharacterized protein n=1 Tax=Aquipluma nitroreducens TaxID=2010828 RepID=A0A5K7SFL2_9BACT|nr:hypothetical protein AQPE_4457 [Aquipluma nitroreducens]
MADEYITASYLNDTMPVTGFYNSLEKEINENYTSTILETH